MVSTPERVVRVMAQNGHNFVMPPPLSDVLTESVQGPECNSFSANARMFDNSTVLQ